MPGLQPRDRDGRYGTVPAAPPTTTPPVPARVNAHGSDREADDSAPDQVSRAYRLFTARTEPVASEPRAEDAPEVWARTYHTRFRRFDQRTLTATKELLRSRPSQMTPEQRHAAFDGWLTQISAIYRMDTPTLRWDAEADDHGGGFYRGSDHSITMSPTRASVITLIHETRHALQRAHAGAPMVSDDAERDARAWSLSLYYKARPALFRRMVRDGRVLHIDPTVFGP